MFGTSLVLISAFHLVIALCATICMDYMQLGLFGKMIEFMVSWTELAACYAAVCTL